MGTICKARRKTWVVLTVVFTVSWIAILNRTAAKAQEPPSIVGSSPLSGLTGATGWINSKPLTAKELKAKVVLVDFLDYSSASTAFAPFPMSVRGPTSIRRAAWW
jgi:hypothetical protein